MKRFWGFVLLMGLLVAANPAQGRGRGRGRSGPAMTPYGPVVNPTSTPEWRQAGGNPMIYEAIMEQKAAAARQKLMQQQAAAMQKQRQAFEKWAKAKKDKGQSVDPEYQQMLDQEPQIKAAAEARAARASSRKTHKAAPAK